MSCSMLRTLSANVVFMHVVIAVIVLPSCWPAPQVSVGRLDMPFSSICRVSISVGVKEQRTFLAVSSASGSAALASSVICSAGTTVSGCQRSFDLLPRLFPRRDRPSFFCSADMSDTVCGSRIKAGSLDGRTTTRRIAYMYSCSADGSVAVMQLVSLSPPIDIASLFQTPDHFRIDNRLTGPKSRVICSRRAVRACTKYCTINPLSVLVCVCELAPS